MSEPHAEQTLEFRQAAILTGMCRELEELCKNTLNVGIKAGQDDPFGFMLCMWTPMLLAHLQSVTILVDNKRSAQAGIIARTMVEGLTLLYWAKEDHQRALRWKTMAIVTFPVTSDTGLSW